MRRSLLALLVSASVIGLAGCGGSGADAASGSALSKQEFIAQGDAICQRLDERGRALTRPTSEAGFAPYLSELVGLARTARDELAALEAPADGAAVQDELTGALAGSSEAIEKAVAAAQGGDSTTAADLTAQAAEQAGAAAQKAKDYGFGACGSGSTS